MSSTYEKLGGFSTEELPQIPTDVVGIQSGTEIAVTWTNNNIDLTGSTNIVQIYDGVVWSDNVEVSYSATSATATGQTEGVYYNIRVSVLTDEGIYYPSTVVPSTPLFIPDERPQSAQYFIPESNAYTLNGITNFSATDKVTICGWFRPMLIKDNLEYYSLVNFFNQNVGITTLQLGIKYKRPFSLLYNNNYSENQIYGSNDISEGEWVFLIMTYTSADSTERLRIYNENQFIEEVTTLSDTPNLFDEISIQMHLNSRAESWDFVGNNNQVGNVAVWTRNLSTLECDEMWNNGEGKKFDLLTPTRSVDLINWWNLDEVSGTFIDSKSGLDLALKNNAPNISLQEITWNDYFPIPNVPTNFIGYTYSSDTLRLTWDDNNEFESGYKIYQDDIEIDDIAKNSTSYDVGGLSLNDTHNYKVSAYNPAGEAQTNNTSITLESPPAPTNVVGDSLQTIISISWTNNAEYVEEIRVYRDTILIDTLANGVSDYIDTGLTSGTTYAYQIGSYINGFTELKSISVDITTSSIPLVGNRPATASVFLGTNQIIGYSNLFDGIISNQYSLATWVKLECIGDYQSCDTFVIWGGEGFRHQGNVECLANTPIDDPRTSISNTAFNWNDYGASPQVKFGEWYFVVLTSDVSLNTTTFYLYDVNGPKVTANNVAPGVMDLNSQPGLFLGGQQGGGSKGQQSCFGTWDKKLTSFDVFKMWNNGDGISYANVADFGFDTDLIEWADFSTTLVTDKKGINYDYSEGDAVTFSAI